MATSRSPKPAKPKATKAAKPPKVPPPTPEFVAGRLVEEFASAAGAPKLWKEADLKRRLSAKERPALAEALAVLQEGHQVLALAQGKTRLYLFTEPLRTWLGGAAPAKAAPTTAPNENPAQDFYAVYATLVRQSGGFPDVKISALQAALGLGEAETLSMRLLDLWRAGGATFSQGDWSLADEATRAAAVELSGERYLLVRLDEVEG